jgi:hypothetical protein
MGFICKRDDLARKFGERADSQLEGLGIVNDLLDELGHMFIEERLLTLEASRQI